MADFITNFFEFIMNGKTGGIPNLLIIIIFAGFIFLVYLIMTRKPKLKEYVPLNMKKETKRRIKKEYKYFGMPLNRDIYDTNMEEEKPIAHAIGFMKAIEMKELKKLVPISSTYTREQLEAKHEKTAGEMYKKPYAILTSDEKRNVDEVSKDELRNEKIEVMAMGEKVKIIRGKKEVPMPLPIPMYIFKVCSPNFMSKILARFIDVGADWFLFDKEQIEFKNPRILLTANFQRRTPNDIFVFSQAGMNLVQDISYGIERENIWQETANQIPRAVHFDTEASKALIYRREEAKLEAEKRRSQTEAHEFG